MTPEWSLRCRVRGKNDWFPLGNSQFDEKSLFFSREIDGFISVLRGSTGVSAGSVYLPIGRRRLAGCGNNSAVIILHGTCVVFVHSEMSLLKEKPWERLTRKCVK